MNEATNPTPPRPEENSKAGGIPLKVPQLKGVQALIQKTSAEAAETPAQHTPPHAEQEAAPRPKLNYLQPEELELIDQRVQKGDAFTAADVTRLLDTLAVYTRIAQRHANEASSLRIMLTALAHKSGGVLDVRASWINALERIKPTMTIARMDNGDLRIQLKSPPVPIVMAHQVPNPKGAS